MKIIVMNTGNSSVDILDVNDYMIENGDVEQFLRGHGFPMGSVSWMAAPAAQVTMRHHDYRLTDGEEKHVVHKMNVSNLEPYNVANALKDMELRELTEAAIRHANCLIDGNPAYRFDDSEDDVPMVPGYGCDGEPCDLVITAVGYDDEYHGVRIYGHEKGEDEHQIDTDDIFAGTIHYITERIY